MSIISSSNPITNHAGGANAAGQLFAIAPSKPQRRPTTRVSRGVGSRTALSEPADLPVMDAAATVMPTQDHVARIGLEDQPRQPTSQEVFSITMRGMSQPKQQGHLITRATPILALAAALAITGYAVAQPVLEWKGTEQLACLDIDFHDRPLEQRPSPDHLEALALRIRPAPCYFCVSHGRGLHCVYGSTQGF